MTSIPVSRRFAGAVVVCVAIAACSRASTQRSEASGTTIGPERGTAVVVGGGQMGPDIRQRFIQLAGGPDALIIDVPTAGGAETYDQNGGGARGWRAAGAKNVLVLHTTDRKVADSDTFVAHIKRAGGVWFDGGRHFRLVDSYGGTKSEAAFHEVLARGGVVGGSSAGASIQGSYLVRGAPSNNNAIMAYPGYEKGFGFLKGVGIDQHVVARERLPDLADSIMPKHPELLLISEDEGTAWFVQGDIGEIVGRSKAFVYNGNDRTDAGKPFLTLWPGDKYNLKTRRVIHRAITESKLTQAFVDSAFAGIGSAAATVLVAQGGKVYANSSYNVPPQRRYQPTTTVPTFELRGVSAALNGFIMAEVEKGGEYSRLVAQRITNPAGMPRTRADSALRTFTSSVDELYRFERLLAGGASMEDGSGSGGVAESTRGWMSDSFLGVQRLSAYGTNDGKRSAFVRFPARQASIIILTDSDAVDARAIAERIAARLLAR